MKEVHSSAWLLLSAVIAYLSNLNWMRLKLNNSSDQMIGYLYHFLWEVTSLARKPYIMPDAPTPEIWERCLSKRNVNVFKWLHTPSEAIMTSDYCYFMSHRILSAQHIPTRRKLLLPILSFKAWRIVDYVYWNNTQN